MQKCAIGTQFTKFAGTKFAGPLTSWSNGIKNPSWHSATLILKVNMYKGKQVHFDHAETLCLYTFPKTVRRPISCLNCYFIPNDVHVRLMCCCLVQPLCCHRVARDTANLFRSEELLLEWLEELKSKSAERLAPFHEQYIRCLQHVIWRPSAPNFSVSQVQEKMGGIYLVIWHHYTPKISVPQVQEKMRDIHLVIWRHSTPSSANRNTNSQPN